MNRFALMSKLHRPARMARVCAAGLTLLLLFSLASIAGAGPEYVLLKTGSLTAGTADSSSVVPCHAYDYMTLEFILTPRAGGADSAVVLYVWAKEILPKYYTGQSSARGDQVVASSITDTTVVTWYPSLGMGQASTGESLADTTAYNAQAGSSTRCSSREIRLYFPARPIAGVYAPRSIPVSLVSTTGAPFQAAYSQFGWRMPSLVGGHNVVNCRVILKGQRY